MTRKGWYRTVYERFSTKGKYLCLMKTIDGQPTVMTIARRDRYTLVASLHDEDTSVRVIAKTRLAALLIPLVNEYVRSHTELKTDAVRISFLKTAGRRRPGKRCVLFAEEAGVHAGPISSSSAERASLTSSKSFAAHANGSEARTTRTR